MRPELADRNMPHFSERIVGDDLADRLKVGMPARLVPYTDGVRPEGMAAFLMACWASGVWTVIESGRGKGAYSTRVLCEAKRRGQLGRVVSVDWEQRFWNKLRSRWLLRKYPEVELFVGDGLLMIPTIIDRYEGNLGILLDGPKGFVAVELLKFLVSRFPNIRVVGLDNIEIGETERRFREAFPSVEVIGSVAIARI